MFLCYQMYIADPAIGHVHTLGREVIQDMPKKILLYNAMHLSSIILIVE